MDSKLKNLIRQASHAGDWYESNSSVLASSLKNWLSKVTQPKEIKLLKGIIGPHAGYYYSGSTAAWSYANITPSNYNRVILLGPCHYKGISSCGLPSSTIYETPLGNLKVDTEEVGKLSKLKNFVFMKKEDEEQEHSLEMHLPYIKHVFGEQEVKLLPIMVGSLSQKSVEYFGKIFSEYLKDDKTLFVISSDFCHWGINFDYMPYNSADGEVWQHIEKLDKAGISHITNQDPEGFLNYLNLTDNTICGRHPITVFLYALKYSGLETKTNLVYYKQSGQVKSKKQSSVSYASIITYL
jgi:AmmeMemoRadiSam system protein B